MSRAFCTYSVLRHHRGAGGSEVELIVESGLTWEAADAMRDELNKAEVIAHPEQTCWNRDLFWVLMEGTDRHEALLAKLAQTQLFL